MPLWSFYLVKVYAWQTMLSDGGVINWALDPFGLSGPGYGSTAVWLVESYLWLPFMILPIYAGLERIPNSLLSSASEDLGAHAADDLPPGRSCRSSFPAVVAGSIFTFSLTLGDYITPSLVSPDTQFIGNVVFANLTNNLPLASAFAMVPIVVMVIYLLIARRLGAFEHLWMRLSRTHTGAAAARGRGHPRLHLHPPDRDRDLRLQRGHDAQVAAREPHHRVVRRRRSTTRAPATRSSLAQGRAAWRPRSRSCSAPWPRFAVARFRFFGRETISFLVVLPIALPGIVTGVALSNTFTQVLGDRPQPVHGGRRSRHLLHRRRLQQRRSRGCGGCRERSRRPRPTSAPTPGRPSASSPCPACGRRWSPAALLAFALSFDEIIVTTFTIGAGDQTLPIWIFTNLFRGRSSPDHQRRRGAGRS